jgi:hypothetical protein
VSLRINVAADEGMTMLRASIVLKELKDLTNIDMAQPVETSPTEEGSRENALEVWSSHTWWYWSRGGRL